MTYRTDRHNNPTAFTTDIARQAGLAEGVDYEQGDSFVAGGHEYHTARLLVDPVALTIRVIDAIGFYAKSGGQRWTYIGMPKWLWDAQDEAMKRRIIGFMYSHEGGTHLKDLFV